MKISLDKATGGGAILSPERAIATAQVALDRAGGSMSIWQKVTGLVRYAFFAFVCLLLLTASSCWDWLVVPPSPPPTRHATLCLEYARQGVYDAFPLGIDHVGSSFNSAGIDLSIDENTTYRPPYRIPYSDGQYRRLIDYIQLNTARASSTLPNYTRHLFAIESFVSWPDTTIEYTFEFGLTFRHPDMGKEVTSFVCVALINSTFSTANPDEAVSGTTVHELGHNCTTALIDCGDDYGQSHSGGGGCVMMDLAKFAGALRLHCYAADWQYSNEFCESCLTKLADARSQFAEP